MAPTTLTTIALVLFALALLAYTGYLWFGSWEPVVRRAPGRPEDEIEVAVLQMRHAIEEYERRQLP